MRAMRKKIKNIHAWPARLLYIRIGNLDWCKCGHSRNEAREMDFLCCREVNAMLIASTKIPEREGSISPLQILWLTAQPLVTGVCFIYLGDDFWPWCSWMKWARWVNLKFYLSLSDFNWVEWEREMNPRFPFIIPGVWELSLIPNANKVE